MIELAVLAVLAVIVVVLLSLAFAVLKLVLWTVLLPVRILLGIVFLPLLILKAVFGGLFLLVIGPIVAIAVIAALVALAAAVLVPLLPLLLVASLLWLLLRDSSASNGSALTTSR